MGKYRLQGTPSYLDPLLYATFKRGETEVFCDLFKADIFSLGLTLLEVATGKKHSKFNRNKDT